MKSSQKRLIAILVSVMVLAGASLVGVTVLRALFARPLFSTIPSPDGALSLRLKGDPTGPIQPIIDHSVSFDLFHNGQPVLVNKFVHSGDWLDPSFNDLYRQHDWVTNSVIRFSRVSVDATKCDRLVVRVETKKPITYLYIESRDLFLVFNPKPESQFSLCAYPQTWLSWIEVEGEFAGGEPIRWKGTNFTINYSPGPFEYQISITADGPNIWSSQLSEYIPERVGNEQ